MGQVQVKASDWLINLVLLVFIIFVLGFCIYVDANFPRSNMTHDPDFRIPAGSTHYSITDVWVSRGPEKVYLNLRQKDGTALVLVVDNPKLIDVSDYDRDSR